MGSGGGVGSIWVVGSSGTALLPVQDSNLVMVTVMASLWLLLVARSLHQSTPFDINEADDCSFGSNRQRST